VSVRFTSALHGWSKSIFSVRTLTEGAWEQTFENNIWKKTQEVTVDGEN
jgi:hypothetical protein